MEREWIRVILCSRCSGIEVTDTDNFSIRFRVELLSQQSVEQVFNSGGIV